MAIGKTVKVTPELSSSRLVPEFTLNLSYKINLTRIRFAEDPGVRGRLNECLETILNKAQEPPKSKKVQHSNAKNAVLFEAISLIIHNDR